MVHLQVPIMCDLISCVNSKTLLYSLSLIQGNQMFTLVWQQPAEGAQVNNSRSLVQVQRYSFISKIMCSFEPDGRTKYASQKKPSSIQEI